MSTQAATPRRPRSLREQCDGCRHFTGIGNDKDGNRIENRKVSDIDNKPEGRGTCRAGVNYNAVQKRGVRMIALPCFKPELNNMPEDGVWPTCSLQSFKTDVELDAEAKKVEDDCRKFMERMTIARPAILKHAGWVSDPRDADEIPLAERGVNREGKAGEMPCPACNAGTLRYRISGYNGHVHAQCNTEGCVSWME